MARKNILAKPYPFSCDLSEQHTNCCPSQKLRSVDYAGVDFRLTTMILGHGASVSECGQLQYYIHPLNTQPL